jgi:DnaJ-class molecular chaperone
MVRDTTLYDRLKVSPDANNNEIMKAYKKLAIQMHPDKNPDDENANTKFQDLNAAKEILTNSEKRKMYDDIGMDYVNGNAPQHQSMNPEDLFSMFGGGGFPGGHPFGHMKRQQQKENIVINNIILLVSFVFIIS